MFCCEGFSESVSNAGKKGLGIVPCKGASLRYFCLQARACDHEDIENLSSAAPMIPVSLRFVEQTGMQFCPTCGANLAKWIKKHPVEFDALWEKLQVYYVR